MSLNGFPDGPPVRTGSPIVDFATGMSACNAILMALLARDRLGRGQRVEGRVVRHSDGADWILWHDVLMTGVNQSRFGNSPNGSPSVGIYEAADGTVLYRLRQRPAVSPPRHRGARAA